jgi:1-acyl-sn-glycerol-3-phosphate acyltransferase
MKRKIAKFILKLFGWSVVNNIPPDTKKFVTLMAPHTSNWDFLLGWFGYMSIGLDSKYLIKKEAFKFPLGKLVSAMGGMPVDRKASNNVVHQVGEMFKNADSLVITIAPEGTRSLSRNWKRGFYYIALNAKVPVALGFLDYKNKIGGIGKMITPTGNYEEDMKEIEKFYFDKEARYPEKFNLSAQNRK